jgi:Cu2+-containing amine oxidase
MTPKWRLACRVQEPVAYKLMPQAHPVLLAHDTGLIARKGTFAKKVGFVVPYFVDPKRHETCSEV